MKRNVRLFNSLVKSELAMASNSLNGAILKQIQFNPATNIKPFDCGNDDLNEFLFPLLNPLHKPIQLELSLV